MPYREMRLSDPLMWFVNVHWLIMINGTAENLKKILVLKCIFIYCQALFEHSCLFLSLKNKRKKGSDLPLSEWQHNLHIVGNSET